MDVRFNEDQVEIARQARRFLEKECPVDYVRKMLDDRKGFTDEIWTGMAEMGWTGMSIPEEYDGLGMDLSYLTVVLEEMGRAVLPGPFFSTVLLAAEAVSEAGNDAQKQQYLPQMASGSLRGTLALHDPESGADVHHIAMEAKEEDDGFVLNGTKLFVPDAHTADFVICPARTQAEDDPDQGITLFLVDLKAPEVTVAGMPTMDATRKLCSVQLNNVKLEPEAILGEQHKGWEPLRKVLQRAQVALAGENVGCAQRAMEIAVDYAKIRVQFDQPIGSFQAIKHRCSLMFQEVESARSLLYWAAWAQDHEDSLQAGLAASASKGYCSEANRNVSTSALQVLGGTGFTWEHDIHLYLKRAKANEMFIGDCAYHREQIASMLAV
jgi:alkylation response protein AidB-like acyl-CoA dehydrogenase